MNRVSVKQVQIEMFGHIGAHSAIHSGIVDQQSHTTQARTLAHMQAARQPFFQLFYLQKTISHEFNNGAIQAHELNEYSQFSKYPGLSLTHSLVGLFSI